MSLLTYRHKFTTEMLSTDIYKYMYYFFKTCNSDCAFSLNDDCKTSDQRLRLNL